MSDMMQPFDQAWALLKQNDMSPCPTCNGLGQVLDTPMQSPFLGQGGNPEPDMNISMQPCRQCNGTGVALEDRIHPGQPGAPYDERARGIYDPELPSVMTQYHRDGTPTNRGIPMYGQNQNPAADIFRRSEPFDTAWELLDAP